MKEWVRIWKNNTKILREVWVQDLRRLDTPQAVMNLRPAYRSAQMINEPSTTSGLVEMQAIFMRARK